MPSRRCATRSLRRYDICRVTPNLLKFVAENSRDAKALRAPKGKLEKWLHGRNGLDIVQEFVVHADPDQWQEVLVRLTPRNYSISSSPLVSPHEVQLTVSVVRYRGADGGQRGGVCSTFLADRASSAQVFLQRSPHFRPPEDTGTPMIMVGPGTGIAPFRGFLQERRALGHSGRNWLFFGDQHRSENFYYRDDLEDMVRDGFLNRLDLAFSRDQAEPGVCAAQDARLRRRCVALARRRRAFLRLWRRHPDGQGRRRRADVDHREARRHVPREAHEYKREFVADKRYVRDVY